MTSPERDEELALYVISVAAELSGLHPQTLRQYDRLGLVSPSRAQGRGRRYSLRDIALLRNVSRMVNEGINWNLRCQIWRLRLRNFELK
jgi:MerR family transcriptional regulator/heat shock protein HspR